MTKPVNVLMGMKGVPRLTVLQLGDLGVRRISIGSGSQPGGIDGVFARGA